MSLLQQATDRIIRARTELIMSRRFYGVLVSNVEPVPSDKFPTMATNGKQHFFNPDFIVNKLTSQSQVVFVQAHESEHDARRHHTRRNGRDPAEWNIACDYAINIDLKDEGFDVPDWAYCDPKYRGMSAEDIYRARELDRQQQQQQQQEEEEQEQQQDQQQQDQDQPGDQGDGDQDQDDDAAGDDAADGDDEADDGDGEGSDGEETDAAGDDASEGSGGADGEEGEGDGSGGDQAEAGDGKGEPQSCGDPGMCGEVIDASDDVGEAIEDDLQWERIVRQAASMAKAIGELPGHITREIERANNPPRDWRDELRAWIDSGALRIETWNRPNRRFVSSGIHMPGSQRDGINKAALLIDTSGSMDEIALAAVRVETQAALDDGIIDEVVVIYGDTRVTRVDHYGTGDEIEFDPRGGGGTNLRPLFQYVADEVYDASLIICFTDMEFGDLGDEPHCPVLFAATGYPDKVKRYLANTPWNAPGIDVGSH